MRTAPARAHVGGVPHASWRGSYDQVRDRARIVEGGTSMSEEADAIVTDDAPDATTPITTEPPAPTPRSGRARAVIASVLVVLAVLLLVVGVVGVWAKATVLRSESVAN